MLFAKCKLGLLTATLKTHECRCYHSFSVFNDRFFKVVQFFLDVDLIEDDIQLQFIRTKRK